ncbi:MAG: hypothetical protein WCP89_02325 [archaeon]
MKELMRKRKKGAIEMSIGTIVVIVLAMAMLVFGIMLINNIRQGAISNVNQMNDKVKDQINKLFVEDKKTVVYLPNQIAEIKQNEDWGIAFGIKNLAKGTAQASTFDYSVVVSDPNVQTNCGVSETEIRKWIKTGQADKITIAPGETYFGIVRFLIPESSPLCTVRFHIDVKMNNAVYATDFFDVEAMAK